MAQFLPNTVNFPLEEQIKTLGDDELLDFWEETQYLEKYFEDDIVSKEESSLEYERLIVKELQLRNCRRTFAKGA
jgi:hypothetical protein